MIHAAGILFLDQSKNALFLKRGPEGDFPGTWCLPGGTQEEGETLLECAIREAKEEVGEFPDSPITYWTRRVSSPEAPVLQLAPTTAVPSEELPGAAQPGEQVDFTTFVQRVDEQFVPTINNESVGYAWAPADQPPEPLHPGVRVVLQRLTMDELGVARAIAAGELVSPQRYDNVTLFAMRVTGTGMAYRHKWKEYVWRDPELYLNDEFLARCMGLPVIMEHPKKAMLDTKEFGDRTIGTIMLPYIKGDEVWCIAKIYDDGAAELMEKEQLSTSPAVVFRDPDVNRRLEAGDGNSILIEGKPSLLDHLAVCEQGVWDKGGEPRGISSDTQGVESMTEEEKKAADDKARKDADHGGETLDKILAGLDACMGALDNVTKRMDSVESMVRDRKADAEEEGEKKADKRKDAAEEEDKNEKKADKRKDAEEDEPEPVMADKKRGRKDADEKEKAEAKDDDDAKKDDDDDDDDAKKDDDDARKDSVSASDLLREVRKLRAAIPKPLTDADYDTMADQQARADEVFNAHGERAPRPMDGETPLAYRRRLTKALQSHSPRWKGANLTAIADATTFDMIQEQVYADAVEAARRPTNVPKGTLRPITRTDSATGHRITEFVGNTSFVRGFKPRSRRVTQLNTRFDR